MTLRATRGRCSQAVAYAAVALAAVACGASATSTNQADAPRDSSAVERSVAPDTTPLTPLVSANASASSDLGPTVPDKPVVTSPSPLATVPDLGSALLDPDEQDPGIAPLRLDVPSISVRDARIVPVGFADNGDLEVPGVDAVGWYQFGAALTRPGSLVLAAHIAFDGKDGIFRHLDDLEQGDEVSVHGADGMERRYRIESVERFRKDALPEDRIWSTSGPSQLVLITCGGRFDRSVGHYEDNVVAFATPL
ncbi:MAG: class F sortase [Acidimicrobiia bacterium]